jgi:hypothetical protein
MKNHKVTYKEVIFCGIQKRGELISFHSLIWLLQFFIKNVFLKYLTFVLFLLKNKKIQMLCGNHIMNQNMFLDGCHHWALSTGSAINLLAGVDPRKLQQISYIRYFRYKNQMCFCINP